MDRSNRLRKAFDCRSLASRRQTPFRDPQATAVNAFPVKVQYNDRAVKQVHTGGPTAILEVANVECVRGDRRLFSNVSFALSPGSFMQLTGPNGSGKTSLLRIISGLMAPERGEIRWQGARIGSLDGRIFPQHHLHWASQRCEGRVDFAREPARREWDVGNCDQPGKRSSRRWPKWVSPAVRNLAVRFLSEGQRRRSALARLLTCGTKLWLLDEVLASLDHAAAKTDRVGHR